MGEGELGEAPAVAALLDVQHHPAAALHRLAAGTDPGLDGIEDRPRVGPRRRPAQPGNGPGAGGLLLDHVRQQAAHRGPLIGVRRVQGRRRGPQAVIAEGRAGLVVQTRQVRHGPERVRRQVGNVHRGHHRGQTGHGPRQVLRRAEAEEALHRPLHLLPLEGGQDRRSGGLQSVGSRLVGGDQTVHRAIIPASVEAVPGDQPEHLPPLDAGDLPVEGRLGGRRDRQVKGIHLRPGVVQTEHLAGGEEGPGQRPGPGSGGGQDA